ncbi:4Fe-4S binding protein, partial [Blautia hydrogenotrophica]
AELHIQVEKCKSCGFCILSCPQKALKLSGSLNKAGYEYVKCEDEKCIKCGICYTVCPDMVFEISE